MTVRPSYAEHGIGVYLKDRLKQAGSDGLCAADLWHDLKTGYQDLNFIRFRGNGTYTSFVRFWQILNQLGYITFTCRTETAHRRDGEEELAQDRHFYRITAKGTKASDEKWSKALAVKYPSADSRNRLKYFREYLKEWRKKRKQELIEAGCIVRPRGRPRVAVKPPVRKRKPPEVKPPKPPVAPPASEEIEREITEELIPLLDRIPEEPELIREFGEKLSDLRARTRAEMAKARGKERENLEALNTKLMRAMDDFPTIPTALGITDPKRRASALAAGVRVVREDLLG